MLRSKANNVHASDARRPAWVRQQTDWTHLMCSLSGRKARSAKAGVRAIPVHGTRHTCGSLLAALDVHPRVASLILRHSKIALTMEIYTHIPSDLTRTALHRRFHRWS